MSSRHATLLAALALQLAALGVACQAPAEPVFADRPAPTKLVLPSRAGLLADYPCSRCHVYIDPSAPSRADAGARAHPGIRLQHFEGVESCTICHDERNRNQLRLLAGRSVGFDASHELCGQCHGEKLRDWQIGAHGKHVGGWAGTKHRFACTDCHNPHAPKPAQVEAASPPPFPHFGIPKQEHP